jgi:hypothetical protein
MVILMLGRRVILFLLRLLKMRVVKIRHRPIKGGQVGPESGQVGTHERRRQVLTIRSKNGRGGEEEKRTAESHC